MPINKILQSDWCCDYSCSDASAIRDCHQTLALRARVWLRQTKPFHGKGLNGNPEDAMHHQTPLMQKRICEYYTRVD